MRKTNNQGVKLLKPTALSKSYDGSGLTITRTFYKQRFFQPARVLLKDTHREKAPSNKTPSLTRITNTGIWVVGTSNKFFIKVAIHLYNSAHNSNCENTFKL